MHPIYDPNVGSASFVPTGLFAWVGQLPSHKWLGYFQVAAPRANSICENLRNSCKRIRVCPCPSVVKKHLKNKGKPTENRPEPTKKTGKLPVAIDGRPSGPSLPANAQS